MKKGLLILFAVLLAPVIAGAQVNSCVKCHEDKNGKVYIHAPKAESCELCHKSNGQPHPGQKDETTFELKDKLPALCYSCHEALNTMSTLHKPMKKGNCLLCHQVHNATTKKRMISNPPDLCYVCHTEFQAMVDTARSKHSVVLQGTACITCHTPHQSAQPKLLITAQRDLCLSCHNKPIQHDSVSVRDIKKELTTNKFIHTEITKNGCAGCHDPHGSPEKVLLKGKFATSTYVIAKSKDNIALCFNCHDPAIVESKNTDVTGFRNGQVNLHQKHVTKYKGRNCVNCHGIHSAPNEFLIVDQSKFGNWNMPLKFTKTQTGGSCITACHAAKTYSRATAPQQ